MFSSLLTKLFGTKYDRDVRRIQPIVDEIHRFYAEFESLTEEQLRAKTGEFRARLAEGEEVDDILPEAFAVVKQACKRLVGRSWPVVGRETSWDMVPFDVQLVGGIVLHQGRIAEMATGEGKTLVATLPLYLNALTGQGSHLVTVNDYLARRDSEWMGEVYKMLGLTVGCIQTDMDFEERQQAYGADITYGTNNEFGFDYLRDNMAVHPDHRVQRGHAYAIVDEVDSVLIDEARTPLIISGPVEQSNAKYEELKPVVERLVRAQERMVADLASECEKLQQSPDREDDLGVKLLMIQRAAPKSKRFLKLVGDPTLKKLVTQTELAYIRDKRMSEIDDQLYYAVEEKNHNTDLLEKGRELISPTDPALFVLPDLATELPAIDQDPALDEAGRIEARERLHAVFADRSERNHNIQQLLKAYALFEKDNEYVVQDGKVLIVDEFTGRLMSGRRYSDGLHSAIEAKEGVRIEGETQTFATITLQNYFRMYGKLAGMTGTAETEAPEFFDIYKLDCAVIPTNKPCVRDDMQDVVYKTKREKYAAIIDEIGVKHNVLNAKQHAREAEIVATAGQKGGVTIATNMAGRGTDIKLGEGVRERGGLFILGTERHESRRIDRQLRGRAGRQGDPGASRFYLSLEDDLMRLFGSGRIAGIMERLGVQEGEVIEHPWVTKAIGTAQKRVEAHNFDIRKHLLEYDNVMNQQRTVIYEMRREALESGADFSERTREMLAEVVTDTLAPHYELGKFSEEWELPRAAGEVALLMVAPVPALPWGGERVEQEEVEEFFQAFALETYRARERMLGPELMREVERNVFLYTLDEKWRDQLYEMDQLRAGIGLRAYGQKDPLVEYKGEAYRLFEDLTGELNRETVRRLFRAQVHREPGGAAAPPPPPRRPARRAEPRAVHSEVTAFGTAERPGEAAAAAAAATPGGESHSPKVNKGPQVGRNDPCPCGSGKKYKKCCMLTEV
ncbi:MAG: preprotein translocase subunit SecA [Candidatus Eisenbacteria bacterium]|nr:preprotein translocase subunit SecA [Candidatus Eisenbacteria bacterium]